MGPSGNDPDSGLQPDVGVDLHVWTTRWEQIEEARPEDPQEALADAADLLDEMFAELEVPIGPAEAPQTEDLVKAREQIRDVVDRLNREAPVDREELDDALDEARRTFDLLLSGRMGNGDAAL
jgi:phage gp36-like protein